MCAHKPHAHTTPNQGSACLDSTTFAQYRDYVYTSSSRRLIKDLSNLFENDWKYTSENGTYFPPYNPTPSIKSKTLMVSPTTSADRFVSFIQGAKQTLDVTTELLGDPTLQSELVAAVQTRGVRVRLISPLLVNSPAPEQQQLQNASLTMLSANGIQVRVTVDPQTAETPYMHARSAVRDGKTLLLGSISYGLNSTTFNREVSVVISGREAVQRVRDRFELDWLNKSVPLAMAM
jgi:cardiolipin synthase A/B